MDGKKAHNGPGSIDVPLVRAMPGGSPQPDFQAIWDSYCGSEPRKITYSVRRDANRFNDIVFLSSFIHDARFRWADVRLNKEVLTIPIERDCWELPLHNLPRNRGELYTARARLTISRAFDVEWRFSHGFDLTREEALEIQFLSLECPDTCRRVLKVQGCEWTLVVPLRSEPYRYGGDGIVFIEGDDDITIVMRDLEVPYLPSQKKSGAGPIKRKSSRNA